MASIKKRGDSWRAAVKRGGRRLTATFPLKAEAEAWAEQQEREVRARRLGLALPRTVIDALEEYATVVSPTHRGERWERIRIEKLKREVPFAGKRIGEVQKAEIGRWRDSMTHLAPESRRREYSLLRAVFVAACNDWEWIPSNPFDGLKPPAKGQPRQHRWTDAEIEAVQKALGYKGGVPETAGQFVAVAMTIAVETAMRKSEILSLTPASRIGPKVVHLRMTKNGDPRNVPLSERARAALDLVPEIPVDSATFDALFRRARNKVGGSVADLHFHDLRREATTRLAAKLDPMQLSLVTGHRDLRTLMRVYYAPAVDGIADAIDRAAGASTQQPQQRSSAGTRGHRRGAASGSQGERSASLAPHARRR